MATLTTGVATPPLPFECLRGIALPCPWESEEVVARPVATGDFLHHRRQRAEEPPGVLELPVPPDVNDDCAVLVAARERRSRSEITASHGRAGGVPHGERSRAPRQPLQR